MDTPELVPAAAPDIRRAAVISDCGQYRYLLVRQWQNTGPTAVFVLLNPSTADGASDDATSRHCIRYARSWGCGSLLIVNLYAWRATKPLELRTVADPVGPENDAFLYAAAATAEDSGGPLVGGWGTHARPDRIAAVLALPHMRRLGALEVTRLGQPHHPLRLSKNRRPVHWTPPDEQGPLTTPHSESSPALAVVITRPGLPDIRLGPFAYPHQALSFASSLRLQMHSTQHVDGSTVTVHPYRPDLTYQDPHVPTDPYQIAEMLDGEKPSGVMGHDFPDLWARLHAQEGYDRASAIWRGACTTYDAMHGEGLSE
ncbi:DUF1643 domain-containing protein [Streptomyces sp. MCC20]|uniref:DUF1643 domain-containing protein n=1 Tax=Streptomyces sediminimaris TaxID=3383721 RepID=UPI00399A08CC